MKKQILNLGKALKKAEQKEIFGGYTDLEYDDDGPCRESYPSQPAGCACNRNDQCASGDCSGTSGTSWWKLCK